MLNTFYVDKTIVAKKDTIEKQLFLYRLVCALKILFRCLGYALHVAYGRQDMHVIFSGRQTKE